MRDGHGLVSRRALCCVIVIVGVSFATFVGCSSTNDASGYDFTSGAGGGGSTVVSAVNVGVGGSASTGLPPEQEVEETYGAPIATGRYVWVANPSSGSR